MYARIALVISALWFFVPSYSATAAESGNCDFSFSYYQTRYCSGSLGGALSLAKSLLPVPAEQMRLVNTRQQGYSNTVYEYRVPSPVEPEDTGPGFVVSGSFGGFCRNFTCGSYGEVKSQIEEYAQTYAETRGYCLTETSESHQSLPGYFQGGGVTSPTGKTYQFVSRDSITTVRTKFERIPGNPECPGDYNWKNTLSTPVTFYTLYFCPEGYTGDVADDRLSADCISGTGVYIVGKSSPQECGDCELDERGNPERGNDEKGNPINVPTGDKHETALDYAAGDLRLVRHYHSGGVFDSGHLGKGWMHNYDEQLEYHQPGFPQWGIDRYIDASGYVHGLASHGAAATRVFGLEGGVLSMDASAQEWVLHHGARRKVFDRQGHLVRLENAGRTVHIQHDVDGRVSRVEDDYGKALIFHYEGELLTHVTLPDGAIIQYHYHHDDETELDTLVAVTNADGTMRQYHYENDDQPGQLTGVTDELLTRYSTFGYDSSGLAVSTELAGGVNRYEVNRQGNGTVTLKSPSGAETDLQYVSKWNQRHMVSASSLSGAGVNFPFTDREVDPYGYEIRTTDRKGTVTEYLRDGYGRETARTLAVGTPDERTIEREFEFNTGIVTQISEPGRVTDYAYDEAGNRLSMTVTDTATGESRSTHWTYNNVGQVLTIDGPRTDVSDITTYSYDAMGNLATVTNALGHVTQFPQYDAHGNPLTIIDPNGVVTQLQYDLRQRLVTRTVAAGTTAAATTAFDYDAAGQLIRTTLPNGAFIAYTYDAAHRLIAIEDTHGNRIDYTLDAMGNRVQETVSGLDDGITRETFRSYNELNRLVSETGPEGTRMDYEYDLEGNRTSITDAAFHRSEQRYDVLDRLFESVDALSGITRYQYDPRDNLAQVIDPRGVTTDYVYNGFDELTETRSPDAGTTTYAYDKSGNRISQTDARGITVQFRYDALNRLVFIDYPGAEKDINYTYDQNANGIGRLARIEDESGSTDYHYTLRGELKFKDSTVAGQLLNTSYDHDVAGNLSSITYPSGQVVLYRRDAGGRVTGLDLMLSDGTTQTLASGITYQPFGPITQLAYGNGLTESRTYDHEGRITAIQGTVMARDYQWDATSNITGINDSLDSNKTQSFGYDALYRLTDATGPYGTLQYDYDAVGNREQQIDNGAITNYSYAPDSNRLTGITDAEGVTSYQYDATGNTLNDGDNDYVYDERNRLVTATAAGNTLDSFGYLHNALGQRVSKPRFQTAIPGDASGDGIIDQNDLLSLHDMIKGKTPANPAADCNQDGSVDNKDVSCIANQIGGNRNNDQNNTKTSLSPQGERAGVRGATTTVRDRAIDSYAASITGELGDIIGQTLFAYDEAGHLIGEYDEQGNAIAEYLWLGDRPIAMLKPNGATIRVYYLHTDHLNTPQVVTDETQAIAWQGDYTPFGDVAVADTSTVEMNLRFPGQYHDAETGLNYNYFRSYNPATGRYTQSDPIGLRGGLNRYGYVSARPLTYLDMFGLDELGIHSNVGSDAGVTAGHSWITHTDSGGNTTTYGLWPDEHPNTEDNGDGTDVRQGMEDGAAALYSRYYDLSPEELARLLEFINRWDEWKYTHTCADWASDAVRYTVGENVDSDDWLGFETPRELSESIRELENGRPTSPENPLPQDNMQGSRGSF